MRPVGDLDVGEDVRDRNFSCWPATSPPVRRKPRRTRARQRGRRSRGGDETAAVEWPQGWRGSRLDRSARDAVDVRLVLSRPCWLAITSYRLRAERRDELLEATNRRPQAVQKTMLGLDIGSLLCGVGHSREDGQRDSSPRGSQASRCSSAAMR